MIVIPAPHRPISRSDQLPYTMALHTPELVPLVKLLGTLLETSAPFRKFCWTILTEAHIFIPTYSHSSSHDTAYYEGRRAVGLEVLHMLKAAYPGVLGLLDAEGDLLAKQVEAAETPTESEDFNEFSIDADGE